MGGFHVLEPCAESVIAHEQYVNFGVLAVLCFFYHVIKQDSCKVVACVITSRIDPFVAGTGYAEQYGNIDGIEYSAQDRSILRYRSSER